METFIRREFKRSISEDETVPILILIKQALKCALISFFWRWFIVNSAYSKCEKRERFVDNIPVVSLTCFSERLVNTSSPFTGGNCSKSPNTITFCDPNQFLFPYWLPKMSLKRRWTCNNVKLLTILISSIIIHWTCLIKACICCNLGPVKGLYVILPWCSMGKLSALCSVIPFIPAALIPVGAAKIILQFFFNKLEVI